MAAELLPAQAIAWRNSCSLQSNMRRHNSISLALLSETNVGSSCSWHVSAIDIRKPQVELQYPILCRPDTGVLSIPPSFVVMPNADNCSNRMTDRLCSNAGWPADGQLQSGDRRAFNCCCGSRISVPGRSSTSPLRRPGHGLSPLRAI